MSERWTPVYDRLFDPDHDMADEPACKRWAWADLCHLAQRTRATRLTRLKPVTLERGELLVSVRFLASRWRWSTSKVGRFLAMLQLDQINRIETVSETPSGTVYRIVAYEDYALAWDTQRDTHRNTAETLPKQIRDSIYTTTTPREGLEGVQPTGPKFRELVNWIGTDTETQLLYIAGSRPESFAATFVARWGPVVAEEMQPLRKGLDAEQWRRVIRESVLAWEIEQKGDYQDRLFRSFVERRVADVRNPNPSGPKPRQKVGDTNAYWVQR